MSESQDQIFVEEWKIARDTIAKLDERLHDLRKYGFTLVTTLFTINSLLTTLPILAVTTTSSGSISVTSTSQGLPALVKFAILGATLVLILVLRLMEKTYSVLQESAVTRASVLERRLNFELTETIIYFYDIRNAWLLIQGIYYAFELAVLLLASAVLPIGGFLLLLILALIEFAYFAALGNQFKKEHVDWTIDRLELKPSDEFRIRFYNLSKDSLLFLPGELWWELRDMDSSRRIFSEGNNRETIVGANNTYAWSRPLNGLEIGVYQVVAHWRVRLVEKGRLGRWRDEISHKEMFLAKKVIVTLSSSAKTAESPSSTRLEQTRQAVYE